MINLKTFAMKKIFTYSIVMLFTVLTAYADKNEDLFNACKQGDFEAVKSAVAQGASVNATDNEGHTPISHSFFWSEIVGYLMDNGADISNSVVLQNAGTFYCEETFKLLLAKGADINKSVTITSTVDMAATYKKLLDAEKAKGDDANETMLGVYEKMMKDAGAPQKITTTMYPFFAAIGSSNKGIINELVRVNANFNVRADDGQTSIGKFVLSVRTPEVLLSYITVSAKGLEGRGYKIPDWFTKLDNSKFMTPSEVLSILTSKGCDVTTKITTGFGEKTPLMTAMGYQGISASDPDAIIALIKAGANVNEVDDKWGTIINLGVRKGNFAIVKAIVEAGADLNVETNEYDQNAMQYVKGFTPLTIAAMLNKIEIASYLLPQSKPSNGVFGFSFNIKTSCVTTVKNKTAIFYAIENNNMELVKALVENTSFNWADKKFTSDQMELSSTSSYGSYTITTTKCFDDGEYSPSEYAEEGELYEMQEYLESKGL